MKKFPMLLGLVLLMGTAAYWGVLSQQQHVSCGQGRGWDCLGFLAPAGEWVWEAVDFLALLLLIVMMLISMWPEQGETKRELAAKVLRAAMVFVFPLAVLFYFKP